MFFLPAFERQFGLSLEGGQNDHLSPREAGVAHGTCPPEKPRLT